MAGSVTACPSCGTKNRLPVAAKGHPRCASCQSDLPWLVDADEADFTAAIDTKMLVVVDLWAPWCGPCRMIAPILEKLSQEMAGTVKIVKVNVDNSPQLAQRYQAQSIPMVLIMDGGTVVESMIGAQREPAYRQQIAAALAKR